MVLYAKDILEKSFLALPRETTVLEAAKKMHETRHGFVVIGSSSNPEGIVTEWDVLSKVVAEGKDPSSVRLSEVMTTDLVVVGADEGIATVAQVMAEKGVRRMLVKQGAAVRCVMTPAACRFGTPLTFESRAR